MCEKATVIYPSKRIDVHWGTQRQVITELLLYREAFCNGPYQYYHLLSGVDLPLKTQPEIHQFLFARKFSVDIDKDIVDRLYAHTINRQLIADK